MTDFSTDSWLQEMNARYGEHGPQWGKIVKTRDGSSATAWVWFPPYDRRNHHVSIHRTNLGWGIVAGKHPKHNSPERDGSRVEIQLYQRERPDAEDIRMVLVLARLLAKEPDDSHQGYGSGNLPGGEDAVL